MKKSILITILSIMFICPYANSQAKIMTFNIRYDSPDDGENIWSERRDELCQLIQYYHPDFIGIQESMPNQVNYIDKKLEDYAFIGFGRDGKGTNSESVPIFYDTTKYSLLNMEVFWLSETPDKISKGWDAALNRITTFGAFKNIKTLDTIYLFNTHFDHMGEIFRKNAAQVLLNKIDEYGLSVKEVIVMGDLNSNPNDEAVLILKSKLNDAFENSEIPPYGPIGTYNAFDNKIVAEARIDYIFTQNLNVLKYRSINDKRLNNLCVSDHLPILIEF